MSELQLEKVQANILTDTVGGILNQVMAIKFTDEEMSAILTVLGIILRGAGLTGLLDFITMLVKLEQQYVSTKAPETK